MKLACVGAEARWGTGEHERFFKKLLLESGIPVDRTQFANGLDELDAETDFVLLSGRDSIAKFLDVDPGLMLARPFVIREERLLVGFPVLHWSSYYRHPGFRSHVKPMVKYLKHVAASCGKGEFWFEHAPLSCVMCNRVEDGIVLNEFWLPFCPNHFE